MDEQIYMLIENLLCHPTNRIIDSFVLLVTILNCKDAKIPLYHQSLDALTGSFLRDLFHHQIEDLNLLCRNHHQHQQLGSSQLDLL